MFLQKLFLQRLFLSSCTDRVGAYQKFLLRITFVSAEK